MEIKFLNLIAIILFVFSNPANSSENNFQKNLQAAQIAANAYRERLEQNARKTDATEISEYVYNIENYNIGISENKSEFVIFISLRKNEMGLLSTGGIYWIDKKTMKINNAVGFK